MLSAKLFSAIRALRACITYGVTLDAETLGVIATHLESVMEQLRHLEAGTVLRVSSRPPRATTAAAVRCREEALTALIHSAAVQLPPIQALGLLVTLDRVMAATGEELRS